MTFVPQKILMKQATGISLNDRSVSRDVIVEIFKRNQLHRVAQKK